MAKRRLSTSSHFDRFARHRGGVAEIDEAHLTGPDDYDGHMILGTLKALAGCEFVNRAGERLSLHAGMTNSMEPDAFACSFRRQHFIGLNLGLMCSALHTSARLIGARGTFQAFGGTPSGGSTDIFNLDTGPDEWAASGGHLPASAGCRRREAALFLRHVMIWFGATHEFYHVLGGHCDLLAEEGHMPELHETGCMSEAGSLSPVHQLLEYLADAEAMRIMTEQVATGRDALTVSGVVGLSMADRRRLLLMGCGLLTATWHALNARDHGDDGLHPRPQTRFLFLLNVYSRAMAALGEDRKTTLASIEIACADLVHAARYCPQLGATLADTHGLSEAREPWDEHDLIRRVRPDLGATLDRLAFFSP